MKKIDSRRRVPVSMVATIAFAALFLFEGLVIGGVIQVDSATVAKIAPWAYEPFLRLVGEFPGSEKGGASAKAGKEKPSGDASDLSSLAGFNPDTLGFNLNAADASNAVEEASSTGTVETVPVVEAPKTNAPPAKPKEVVPVG